MKKLYSICVALVFAVIMMVATHAHPPPRTEAANDKSKTIFSVKLEPATVFAFSQDVTCRGLATVKYQRTQEHAYHKYRGRVILPVGATVQVDYPLLA